MKKNFFKKQNIMDTAVNVGIGGAANVAVDYAMSSIDALSSLETSTKNYIKLGAGIVGGALLGGKYLRPAFDGIATVAVSEIVAGLMGDNTTSGLPQGTIGRIKPGNAYFRRRRVSGTASEFMGK